MGEMENRLSNWALERTGKRHGGVGTVRLSVDDVREEDGGWCGKGKDLD